MTAFTPFMSAATSAIIASSEGARRVVSEWMFEDTGAALAVRRRFS
jgi:hypothetical protein